MSSPIPRVNRVYAAADTTPAKPCVNRNNPHGHSKTCPCGWWKPPARDAQRVPYVEDLTESPWGDDLEDIDGVDRDTDAYLEWADDAREAEMDRQMGAGPWQ